jgi:hypothetical protein
MADSPTDSPVPPLTRLVRAAALLAAQGASVGYAANTLRLWSRLDSFVATNRMSAADRTTILGWLVLPAVAWGAFSFAVAAWRTPYPDGLTSLERKAQRCSWAIAAGLLPTLLHPTLWKTRTPMFLIATGFVALVAWWSTRVTQKGLRRCTNRSRPSDFERIVAYASTSVPLKLKLLAPMLVLGAAVLYVVTRGVWMDSAAVRRLTGDPPLAVHSLRQAFQMMGHGGWVGIPVVVLRFLRPPSHAHLFFWALCTSSAAFPLYFWVRRNLGVGIALLLSLCYLSMPALRTVGRDDVFPVGVAAGLFFLAALEWERKSYGLAIVMTLLTVGIHEQAALWFTCLGIYLGCFPDSACLGRRLALASLVYFAAVAFLLLPHLGFDPYKSAFKGLWGYKAVGLIDTLVVTVTNPAYVLTRWIDLQGLSYWLAVFVPFAFLPIAGRNWLLWAMPGVLFAVVAAGRTPSVPVTAAGTAHFVVLGFAASITTLARLRAAAQTRQHANAALVAWVFALVPCTYQLGGLWLPAL